MRHVLLVTGIDHVVSRCGPAERSFQTFTKTVLAVPVYAFAP
jgi:hypothetical protein